jgi:4-amino-4-deoxy-L-arabinose transferase-like glycosyltransferase
MATRGADDPGAGVAGGGGSGREARRRWLTASAVVLLLLVLLGQLAYSVSRESLSWDEGNHIFAGYMAWKHHDHGLNPEHPPFVKMVAALPLLFMDLREPVLGNRYFKSESYLSGRDLIFGNDFDRVIFRARMGAACFALLLALVVFLTAREMFGTGAGLLALALVVFEPNLLAHGAMVTTDTGAAGFLLLTIYAFYRYVKAPSTTRLLAVGVAAGLMAITKHSAVLLAPMLGLLALTELVRRRAPLAAGDGQWAAAEGAAAESRVKQALRFVLAAAVIVLVAAALLWTCYGFRFAARPAGWQLNPPFEATLGTLAPREARAVTAALRWHLLPESYLFGLADVRSVANVWPSYIFGKVYAHGVWFYFPVAFAIKATLGLLGLLLLTIFALASGRLRKGREVLFLAIPPGLYMLVSMTSQLNIGVRHILLVFVFCCVLAAGGAWALVRSDRRWLWPVAALLLLHVGSSLRAFPVSYMAYSNELWGGPSATYKYLTDSNTDWGQQLKATKRYLDERGVKDCWFAYFVAPAIQASAYGIPCRPLPTADTGFFGMETDVPLLIDGPVLFSHSSLTGYELGSSVFNPYQDFLARTPTTIIEHGVWVFDGRFEVPLVAAFSRAQKARMLFESGRLDAALTEARAGLDVAPSSFPALLVYGETLQRLGRRDEARAIFERALPLARTMEPTAREVWIPELERRLAAR